jgi:hypothetical protein
MYRIAYNKNIRIKKLERILEDNSIDCELNKEVLSFPKNKVNITLDILTSQRNIVKNFRLGDSKDREITCKGDFTKTKIDDSTFNRVFIIDDINLYKKYIALLYHKKKSYTFEDILEELMKNYKTIDSEILIYALDEMIIDKYKINDIKNRQGYLIYKSDRYIFQYSNLHDIRMTLEEREEISLSNKPNQIDFLPLIDHISKTVKPKKEKVNKTKKVKKEEDIIDLITIRYNDKIKIYKPILGPHLERFESKIMDFIVDRLSEEEFTRCIEYLSDKINKDIKLIDKEKNIARSLIDNECLLFDKDDKVKYIYNYYQKDLYCVRQDNKFNKCGPLDINSIGKDKYEEIIAHKKITMDTTSPSIRGFIMYKAGELPKLKLKDPNATSKSKGYICTTAVIKILKNKIEEMELKDLEKHITVMSKVSLCDLLELLLRDLGKSVFKRNT